MTFLAVLFATAPTLEAAACAAEGCSIACLQEAATDPVVASDDADNAAPEGCADQGCFCAVGHCHAGSIPAPVQATYAPIAINRGSRIESERLVSASPSLPERPPRA